MNTFTHVLTYRPSRGLEPRALVQEALVQEADVQAAAANLYEHQKQNCDSSEETSECKTDQFFHEIPVDPW